MRTCLEKFIGRSRWKRVAALLLCALLCVPLGTIPSAAAGVSEAAVLADGTVDIWKWERVNSQSDLPESSAVRTVGNRSESYDYAVLLLYECNGGTYMVHGSRTASTDDDRFAFSPVSPAGAVRAGDSSFRTKDNVSGMTLRYVGRDPDNGSAKQYMLLSGGRRLTLKDDGFQWDGSDAEEYNVSAMTYEVPKSDANVSYGKVKLFANISGAKDHPMFIDEETKRVYTESSNTWDMAQFTMYIGHKEQWSAVTHDITVQSGVVENLNGYIYVSPGVTITVEEGGVLSCSGVLYNNGYLYNKGDIVVQPGATIEQFCLSGSGGSIACDGGDLVILSGGRVTTDQAPASRFTRYREGFCLQNGATCTNFGTLVIGSSAYVESGATIDNRTSGNIFVGFRLKSRDIGNFSAVSASNAADPTFYASTMAVESNMNMTAFVFHRADRLYGGDDVLLQNNGTVYLSTTAQTLTVTDGGKKRPARNLSCAGTGKLATISSMSWVVSLSDLPEYCPAAWKPMIGDW